MTATPSLLTAALVLTLAGCRGASLRPTPEGAVRSPGDTADVLAAVWEVPASNLTGSGVRWLYLPSTDSAAFTASAAVRAALVARGVPASTRRPAGHDTVVFRVDRWARDSAGWPVLTVSSGWTHLSTSTPAICMSAGNVETYRARRTRAGWEAERSGPGLHGGGYCPSKGRRA